MAFIATLFLCVNNLQAQKTFKIGDEYDSDVSMTKSYQKLKEFKFKNSNGTPELVFSKEFYSQNSSYVKLYFKDFDLAPGDYVEITGSTTNESIIYGGKGKIIDSDKNMISNFWSKVIFDEKVEVKLYSTGKIENEKGFEITKVAYGYSNEKLAAIFDKNKQLQSRAICSSDNKEQIACYAGTDMFEKAKAVCRLIINGSSSCTGWLLGSEGHLMTNNHCIGSASAAQNTDFVFNFQNTNCSGTNAATSDVVASSATFIKTSSSLDYTLVRLPTNPTSTYGFLSLSSVLPSAGDRIYIPQHPGGRRKEISVNTDSGFSTVNCVGNCATPRVPQKTINYFADTEGGSSGSPVIDFNSHLVLAIHNTGECPNGSFGRSDDLISSIGNDMPNDGVDGNGGGGTPPGPTQCSSTISSFPYAESFESNVGWTQASGDDGNWVRDASGTPSNGTGPSGGANGSFYLFLEASSNGSTGEIGANGTAILESPCFDLSSLSSASFSFSNHMFGTSVGSLQLEASTDGANWTSLWSDSGNQGNQWNAVTVNLNSYVGQNQVRLRFVGTTGSSWSSDIAIDNLSLTSGGGSPTPSCPTVDFNDFSITSFSNQDSAGNFSVGNSGASLTLTNNTWKYIPLNYTVTANTVIEFQFSSTAQGEIHGIGFEDDNTLTANRYFKVHGTQNYGITNFDNYTSGTVTYTIPVGSSYTGNMDRLVFINDNDAGSGNTSTFSNVRIYEGSCENSNVVVAESFGVRVDTIGDEDEGAFTQVQIAPNPLQRGSVLRLLGPSRSLNDASYSVINMLGQTIQKGNIDTSKVINTNQLNSGVYILRIENKFTKTSKRFIIE